MSKSRQEVITMIEDSLFHLNELARDYNIELACVWSHETGSIQIVLNGDTIKLIGLTEFMKAKLIGRLDDE
jgi:hypothetical protein